MVFFNALYRGFLLFVVFGFFFWIAELGFGIRIWPGNVNSYIGYLTMYLFCVFVVLSATYK